MKAMDRMRLGTDILATRKKTREALASIDTTLAGSNEDRQENVLNTIHVMHVLFDTDSISGDAPDLLGTREIIRKHLALMEAEKEAQESAKKLALYQERYQRTINSTLGIFKNIEVSSDEDAAAIKEVLKEVRAALEEAGVAGNVGGDSAPMNWDTGLNFC